jgi:hypothetical protein
LPKIYLRCFLPTLNDNEAAIYGIDKNGDLKLPFLLSRRKEIEEIEE